MPASPPTGIIPFVLKSSIRYCTFPTVLTYAYSVLSLGVHSFDFSRLNVSSQRHQQHLLHLCPLHPPSTEPSKVHCTYKRFKNYLLNNLRSNLLSFYQNIPLSFFITALNSYLSNLKH